MLEGRRILITGGFGFLGSAIARRLVERNRVTLFDLGQRPAPGLQEIRGHASVATITGDVLDREALARAADGAELVFHLAAVAGVRNYHDRPARTIEVNAIGTWHALEAALAAGCRRFVHFSSSEVYGADAEHASEEQATPIGPVAEARWSYAAGKIAAEHLAHAFGRERGLPVVSLRPFNVYGPGQVGEGAVHAFVVRALLGLDLEITGDGSQRRAWCYVDDLVDAAIAASEAPEALGECLNVGNPAGSVSTLDLAMQIRARAASQSRVVHVAHVGADVRRRAPVIDRARELLGFEPKVSLDEGLRRTLEAYRALPRPALEDLARHLAAGAPHAGRAS